MDIVYIRDLRIDTFIGIYDWEQQLRQTLSLDLEMATDVAAVAASGELADTLDYKAISDRLIGMIENQHFELLESLAEQIAQTLQDEFQVGWLRMGLRKRRGRLRKGGEQQRRCRVQTYITDEEYAELEAWADQEDRSILGECSTCCSIGAPPAVEALNGKRWALSGARAL